ncbi:hypothetical protein ACSZMZ_04385 [Aeromonas veronii]
MQCMPSTILRSFEDDERAMVPGPWFMAGAAGAPIAGYLSGVCNQPSVAGSSLVFSKIAICYLAQGNCTIPSRC